MKFRSALAAIIFPLTTMAVDYNTIILEQIKTMPAGGRYSVSSVASENLRVAVTKEEGKVGVDAAKASPSYCSGATYLVFLKAINEIAKQEGIALTPEIVDALLVRRQRDGDGIWGRWNANGPGTARLFDEARLGKNFTSYAEARPGDFMKIFWIDAVGKKERGHLVVYLGMETRDGKDYVKFWSSNIPDGYGEKIMPSTRIARVIFSRLENPKNIVNVTTLPKTDAYLASLLTKESSFAEAKKLTNTR